MRTGTSSVVDLFGPPAPSGSGSSSINSKKTLIFTVLSLTVFMTFTSGPDPYVFWALRIRIRPDPLHRGTKMSRIHNPQHWYKDGKTDSQVPLHKVPS